MYKIIEISNKKDIKEDYLGYKGDVNEAIKLAQKRIGREIEGFVYVYKEKKDTYIYVIDRKYFKDLKDHTI